MLASVSVQVASVAVNVLALGVFKQQLQDFVFGYDVDEEASSKNREAGETLARQIEEEGVTMKVMRLRLHFACKRLSDYAEEQKAYEELQKSIVRTPIKLYLF